jgi:outer membrane lipoprotein SlyB
LRGIGGETGNDLAGFLGLIKGGAQGQQVFEQRITDVRDNLFAEPHHVIEANGRTYCQEQDNGDHHAEILMHQH